jgi:hypothetical protein
MMNDMNKMMQVLQSPDGLKNVILEDAFEAEDGHSFSQADLIADVVNILRLDTKRIAESHGVEVEIDQMTPARAAELLQAVAKGGDMGLIEIFDKIEDQRMMILEEIEDEDAVENYMEMKRQVLHTVPAEPQSDPDPDEGGEGDEEVDEDES